MRPVLMTSMTVILALAPAALGFGAGNETNQPLAIAVIGGVRQKIHFFCLDLPQSDACFVKAYPRETTEAFLDGHVSAFGFFGGVPLSVLYDNTRIAVAKICGDGRRERTRAFTELVSHYLFRDRFGRPGKGNDKGKVEGLVKYARSNFMTPIPVAASLAELNAMLAERCRRRQDERAADQEQDRHGAEQFVSGTARHGAAGQHQGGDCGSDGGGAAQHAQPDGQQTQRATEIHPPRIG